jgi:hypothetical protein
MAALLPLDNMSVEEKIQAMESLWNDLCSRADDMVSPSWHGNILAEREHAVERGQEKFEDWDRAKRNIKKEIS